MQTTVTITDDDRRVEYHLLVTADWLPGARPRAGWRDGGEPGCAPAVEIAQVRCLEIDVWCGPALLSALPPDQQRESLERSIGRWCLERYPREIEQAVLGAVQAAREAQSN